MAAVFAARGAFLVSAGQTQMAVRSGKMWPDDADWHEKANHSGEQRSDRKQHGIDRIYACALCGRRENS